MKTVSIRRSLLTNILRVIVLLGGVIITTAFLNTRQLVEVLPESLISKTLDQIEGRLTHFYQLIMHELLLTNAAGDIRIIGSGGFKNTQSYIYSIEQTASANILVIIGG